MQNYSLDPKERSIEIIWKALEINGKKGLQYIESEIKRAEKGNFLRLKRILEASKELMLKKGYLRLEIEESNYKLTQDILSFLVSNLKQLKYLEKKYPLEKNVRLIRQKLWSQRRKYKVRPNDLRSLAQQIVNRATTSTSSRR